MKKLHKKVLNFKIPKRYIGSILSFGRYKMAINVVIFLY